MSRKVRPQAPRYEPPSREEFGQFLRQTSELCPLPQWKLNILESILVRRQREAMREQQRNGTK